MMMKIDSRSGVMDRTCAMTCEQGVADPIIQNVKKTYQRKRKEKRKFSAELMGRERSKKSSDGFGRGRGRVWLNLEIGNRVVVWIERGWNEVVCGERGERMNLLLLFFRFFLALRVLSFSCCVCWFGYVLLSGCVSVCVAQGLSIEAIRCDLRGRKCLKSGKKIVLARVCEERAESKCLPKHCYTVSL